VIHGHALLRQHVAEGGADLRLSVPQLQHPSHDFHRCWDISKQALLGLLKTTGMLPLRLL